MLKTSQRCCCLVACSIFATTSCSVDKNEKASSKVQISPNKTKSLKPDEDKRDSGTRELKPERRQPKLEPLPAPLAHFGELPLKRLSKPIEFQPVENKSVILVIVDALNAKHLGIYGYDRDTSPNLDKFAERGVLLTNYVSNSSWTRPSFTTLITGQPKNVHHIEWDGNHLDKKVTTLAERFRSAGYKTHAIVGNQLVQKLWGFNQGFQTYEDVKSLDQIFPRDELLVNKAISWLKKVGDKPFFLMLFLIDPHTPYRPLRAHRQFLDPLPKGEVIRFPFREYKEPLPKLDHDRIVAAYDGEINSTDTQIGRLIDFLSKRTKFKDTSIAITADHGEAFNDHGCYTHTYHMWESVIRVPFMLLSPAIKASGIYDDRPYTHIDMAPTLLDLAGVGFNPGELPGLSIAQALNNPNANRERVLFTQYNSHGVRRQAIRKGSWKLVHHHKVRDIALKKLTELQVRKRKPDPENLPTLAWDKERHEFYNIGKDPGEAKDLLTSHRDSPELKELMDALHPYLLDGSQKGQITKEMQKALENIGYVKRQ
ncbi:MAG: sulfatase [Proteobacteria bacterium]|nr:sulfatase [Pseudomonadota bacterium]